MPPELKALMSQINNLNTASAMMANTALMLEMMIHDKVPQELLDRAKPVFEAIFQHYKQVGFVSLEVARNAQVGGNIVH